MPIHLEFTLTFEEYFAAMRLHSRRSFWRRLNWICGGFIAPVVGVLVIAVGLLIIGPGVPWIAVGIVLAYGLFLVAYPVYRRWRLRSCYSRTRIGTGHTAVDFGEMNIRTQAPGAKSEIDWAAVNSFAEDKNVFLVYVAPAKFIAIPKRACSEIQIDEIQHLFGEKITGGKGAAVTG